MDVDARLRELGMGGAWLRLQIGAALEVMKQRGWHAELGCSSFSAYVLERCHRGARWARESRLVARRISATMREQLLTGRITWSMAELLCRHLAEGNEETLLEAAASRTVGEMRVYLGGKAPREQVTLRVEGDEADVAFLEASRVMVRGIDGKWPTDDELMVSLLAEGESTLAIGDMPIGPMDLDILGDDALAEEVSEVAPLPDIDLPQTPNALDAEIRRLCAEYDRRDLEIGRLAKELVETKAWRALDYRSAAAYAEDRLGMSMSSLRHRMTLARRVEALPEIGEAMSKGVLGYEAAMLLSRVATPDNAAAWVERAAVRTLVHLREEVDAVELNVKLDPTSSLDPPSDEVLEEVADFERKVLGGDLLPEVLGDKAATLQISVVSGTGREVRLRVTEETLADYERVRANFYSVFPPDASFLAFLCIALLQTWQPIVEEQRKDKWARVHLRDRYRCSNPTCSRSDVTAHHLRYQSHGGGDEEDNVGSLCYACHIRGVHGGRIRADPPAPRIRWALGRTPMLYVDGRTKHEAAG